MAAGYRRLTNISGWDIYRTQVPLLALIEPEVHGDLARSMIAGAEEAGSFAKWEYAGVEAGIMVGDPAAPIIAGAYAFGVRPFDLSTALTRLEAVATQPSPGPFVYPSNVAPTDGSKFGAFVERPGLADYLALGFVPYDQRSGTIWGPAATTLEYGVADFAISESPRHSVAQQGQPRSSRAPRPPGGSCSTLQPDTSSLATRTARSSRGIHT